MLQSLEPTLSPSSEYSSASKYLLNTWEPKLDTVFQMWPHKCQVNGKSNFPSSAGSTLVNVVWCVVSLHYLKDAVLILVQFFHWDSQIPFCRAATSSVSPQAIPLHGIFFCPGCKTLSCQHLLQLVQGLQPCPLALQTLSQFHIMHVLRVSSSSSSRSLSTLNSISPNIIAPWGTLPITSCQWHFKLLTATLLILTARQLYAIHTYLVVFPPSYSWI